MSGAERSLPAARRGLSRKRRAMRLIAGLGIALASAACARPRGNGDGTAGTGGIPGDMSVVDRFAAAMAALSCRWDVCYQGLAPSLLQDCSVFDQGESLPNPVYKISYDEGRIRLNEMTVEACLAAVTSLDPAKCWGPQGTTKPWDDARALCASAIIGQVKTGGTCYVTQECANGWCDLTNHACPGTCKPYSAVGANCSADSDQCPPGSECTGIGERCEVPRALGESCSWSGTDGDWCAGGLYCDGQHCVKQQVVGDNEVCGGPEKTCEPGSYCGGDPNEPLCQPVADSGEPCSDPGDIACKGRQLCTGVCETPSDVNGPCKQDSDCFKGLDCDTTTSRCRVPPDQAQSCAEYACGLGLDCDPTTETCVPITVDNSCGDATCTADQYCDWDSTTCKRLVPTGAACNGGGCVGDDYCDPTTQKCVVWKGCVP